MKFSFCSIKRAALTGSLISSSIFGATVGAGSFSLSGTTAGVNGGIEFYLHSPGDHKASVNLPTTGAFASLMPTTEEVIQDLTSVNGVMPGGTFDFQNWIQLTNNINLDANWISIPTFPVCTASSPETDGYQCLVRAQSPVVLTQTATGVAAQMDVSGWAHFAGDPTLTPFVGLFSAPTTGFSSIADFEDYFTTNGAIPTISYAANFTLAPEPAVVGLAGCGLIFSGLLFRSGRRGRS